METVTMNVKGMTCGGCVASVTRVLKALPGVESVDVKLQPGQATVRYDASKVALPRLKAAIEDAGYDVPA
jgi:copper ion binding protein